MKKTTVNMLQEAVLLIKAGNSEEACRVFLEAVEREMVSYLKFRYRWEPNDALLLLHSAYLLIEEQVKSGKVTELKEAYIKGICRNLGANAHRKLSKERDECKKYINESRANFNDEMMAYTGIQIYAEDDEVVLKKTLAAFNALNGKCREIIEYKYVHNMSHKEIVDVMSDIKNEEISRTTLKRCMKKLRELMQVKRKNITVEK